LRRSNCEKKSEIKKKIGTGLGLNNIFFEMIKKKAKEKKEGATRGLNPGPLANVLHVLEL